MGNTSNKAFRKEKSHLQASAAADKKKLQGPKKPGKRPGKKPTAKK
ncbi:MAG: hypothetical protein IPP14_04900 [Planctomycetes bacterium]|nr:hypothetical protein [Planctomycetota bacterium]